MNPKDSEIIMSVNVCIMPGTTLGQNEIFKFKNALTNFKMVLWLVMKPSHEKIYWL